MAGPQLETRRSENFYRLAEDRHCTYGDGGADFLQYPVWINNDLGLEDCRKRLVNAFDKLNEQRQDHHVEPSPVEDIIDPDLLLYRPNEFDREAWIEQRAVELEKEGDWYNSSNFETAEDKAIFEVDNKINDHIKLRGTYQWTPAEFNIQQNGHVKIVTPINQLEKIPENQQLYEGIAHVFEAMLPAFQISEIVGENAAIGKTLQVVVKAQTYNLKAGMKYAGRWHTEGDTENIIAAGVYYVHVDEKLEGGALKFRPKNAPQPWYGIPTDEEISVQTGAAIIFSNSIPHRFRQIRNLTNENDRRRTFLNFFIIDPLKPIRLDALSSRVLTSLDIILSILNDASDGRLMLGPVLDKILQWLGPSAWQNQQEAKDFRAEARRAMLENQSGWGWVGWGNCGHVEFVKAFCLFRYAEECEELRHTESD